MDGTLTEEQQLIRDSAREVLSAECTPDHVRAMARDPEGYDPALYRRLAELGWHGIAVPEDDGGMGLGFLELCLLLEEQGRSLLPGPFLSTVVLAGQAITQLGTTAQRERILPALVAGEHVVAVARVGPDRSWSPLDVGVHAQLGASGVVLSGAAELVEYAHVADELLVLARHEAGLVAVLVPAGTEGLRIEPVPTVGRDHRSRVSLDGVRLPAEAVLGDRTDGERLARALHAWGAVACCAEMLGAGERILELSVAWATERKAFGVPIGTFQAIQHHCANMAVDVMAARGVTWDAAGRLASGEEAEEAVAVAKAWVSDAMARVAALGHQVHGAIGFTEEHDLHLYARRIRARELDFGDAAWHRARLASHHELSPRDPV